MTSRRDDATGWAGSAPSPAEPEGGEAACWLGEVCDSCGRLPDEELSEDGRCARCRDR